MKLTPAEKREYASMLDEVRNPWCWACGLGPGNPPEFWNGPWMIQRAHITNKPRVEARWAVVLLCPLCHEISHGRRFPGVDRPRLKRGHLLWLKAEHDPKHFDRERLQRCCVGTLPRRTPLPVVYTRLYQRQAPAIVPYRPV